MLTIVIGDYDKEGGGGDCQVSVVEGELSLVIMLLDNQVGGGVCQVRV